MSEGTITVGTKVRVRTGFRGRPPVGIVTRTYVNGDFKVSFTGYTLLEGGRFGADQVTAL